MALGSSGDPLLLKALGMIGPRMLAEVAWSVITLHPRSLAEDSRRTIRSLNPPPKIEGAEHIPHQEPFLLVANHFQATRLWVGWVVMAINAAVASVRAPHLREVHWMIMAEWRGEFGGREIANPLTSAIFPRAARVWGLVSLPTASSEVGGRASALRQALAYLGARKKARVETAEPVAIFPEGMASVALREARPGSGAFIHRVNAMGVPLLPVGVHEEAGSLVIRFGPPFSLPTQPANVDVDDWAKAEVMSEIGRLLPSDLWGAYAGTIERKLESGDRESEIVIRDT